MEKSRRGKFLECKDAEKNLQQEEGEKKPTYLVADTCFNIEYKKLKAILRNCPHNKEAVVEPDQNLPRYGPCAECREKFLNEITSQISSVEKSFASCSRSLLRPRITCGFEKILWRPKNLFPDSKLRMMEETCGLITYAARNAMRMRKLLSKFERNRDGGENLCLKLQNKRVELLKSPLMIELCALYINSASPNQKRAMNGFACSFTFNEMNEPTIICGIHESLKIDFNLNCPICLEMVFEPVALGCGHIFCNSCACTSASVPTIVGLKTASSNSKCPICRQTGVYCNSVRLRHCGLLLQKRCEEIWKERLRVERAARLQEARDHWNNQSRLFVGF